MAKPTGDTIVITIAIREAVYPLDFVQREFQALSRDDDATITQYIVDELRKYSEKHFEKFIGAGLPADLPETCPRLTSRLWLELDIMPLVVRGKNMASERDEEVPWESRAPDEQAELLSMKCVR